jgi:hypothetical protein
MVRTVALSLIIMLGLHGATNAGESDGQAIDATIAHNHRVCIASGGLWDMSVAIPTKVPGHPMVGWCSGMNDKPACPTRNLESRCWRFVDGDAEGRTTLKALPQWRACRANPPDPLC